MDIKQANGAAGTTSRRRTRSGIAFAAIMALVGASMTFVLSASGTAVAARTPGEIVRYDFAEGSGTTVGDSGSGNALDLTIANPTNVTWGADGLTIDASTKISSITGATKVVDAVKTSGAFTLEAWVASAAGTQSGPARLISNSPSPFARNFLLGQGAYGNLPDDVFSFRSSTSSAVGGTPELFTSTGVVSTELTHVVATRNAAGQRAIYVDGVSVANDTLGGDTANWDDTYPLVLGNVETGNRPWLGTYCLVAVYDSALSPAQVTDNFDTGCGVPNNAPVLDAVANQNSVEGNPVSVATSATDPDGDILSFSATNLPAGITIDSSTGAITGTVGQSAATGSPYTVTVTAADGNGGSDSTDFTWTIDAVNVDPVLAPIGDQSSAEGQTLSLSVPASDVDGDALTYSATNLPTGLTINPTTGVITGTVAGGAVAGSPYTVEVSVSDGLGGTDSESLLWQVTGNSSPVLDPIGAQASDEGQTVSVATSATDPDSDPLTYSASALPPGLTISSTTGIITGTISQVAAPGSPYTSTVSVSDGKGGSGSESFSWTITAVNVAPVLAAIVDQSSNEGASVSLSTPATDADGDTLSYAATGLPTGLAINTTTGAITGTVGAGASATSPYAVTVSVSDGSGGSDAASFVWTVNVVTGPSPVINYDFTEGSGATVGDSGSGSPLDLTIADPGNVSWVPGGGLVIDSTTTIASPQSQKLDDAVAASGEFTVEAWVTPALGTQSGPARIVSNAPTQFTRNFMLGQGAYSSLPDNVFSVRTRTTASAGGTPELFTSTGVTSTELTHIVATRAASGARTIYVNGVEVGSDTIGGSTTNWDGSFPLVLGNVGNGSRDWSGTFCRISIYDDALNAAEVSDNFGSGCSPTPNNDPVLDPTADQTNVEGDAVSVEVTALDADGDTLTISAVGLPDGLLINTATGEISGTVSQTAAAGSVYSVTVTVDDGNGGADSETFDWTISPVNVDPVLSTIGDQASEAGEAISLLLAASDDDGDSLTYSVTGLPTGLSFDASGLISGTVDLGIANSTVFAATVTVSDGQGGTDSETFAWTIAANTTPVFDTPVPGDQTSNEGDTVSNTFAATDPDGDPLTYSAIGLPADLTIDPATGEVSGTLSQTAAVGSPYAVIVTVADNRGAEAQNPLSWTVDVVNLDPVLDAIADQSNNEGDVVALTGSASDLDGDALTFGATGLPPTLSIDPSTGEITGSIDAGAAANSPFTVEITVDDGAGGSDSEIIAWTVSTFTGPDALVRYEFNEGSGSTVSDTGTGDPLDLTIADLANVTWIPGGGLSVDAITTIQSAESSKIVDAVQASSEFTIEAWVRSGLAEQEGPARLVANGPDPFARNFMLGEGAYGSKPNNVYSFRSRTELNPSGTPELFSNTGTAQLDQLTHVVATRDAAGNRIVYVDGVESSSDVFTGGLANWNATYPLALANVSTGNRGWIGTLCQVAVYDVVLSPAEVAANNGAGCDLQAAPAEALVQITPDGVIDATTFGNQTITVTNNGGANAPKITKVEFDLRGSLIPDATFDPVGTAGDEGTQCLEVSAEGGTGYVVPGENCIDPFSLPHEDDPGTAGNGNDGMTLDFTDFDTGEAIVFGVDVDPTSIQGVAGAGGAGAVSGLELTGSTVTVTFSDGQVLSNQIFGDGSVGGGQAVVAATKGLTPPTGIELVGVAATPTVFTNNSKVAVVDGVGPQVVRVAGPVGSSVTLLDANGQLQSPAPFDPDPFESDTVVSVSYLTGIITGTAGQNGTIDFDVAIDSATDLHHFVATIDDGANGPLSQKLIVAVDTPSGALVQITPNGVIGASTFTNGTMSITNTGDLGGPAIASVSIDLRGSIVPDATFDPNGVAGDTTPKCLVISAGGPATGYATPVDNCNDPFTVPHEDEPGQPGFGHDVMTLDFTDFGAGETISFAVDIDATSIQGFVGSGGAGSVSGLELTGSLVTVTFDDGATQTAAFGQIFGDGSAGGGTAVIDSTTAVLAPPAIQMVGVTTSPTVFTNGSVVGSVPATGPQTVQVSGPEGATVTLLQMTGDLVTVPGFDIDDFESDTAVAVEYFTGTIVGGAVDFPVDIAVDDVLYHYTAVIGNGSDGASTQLVIGVGLDVNAPVIDPIADVSVTAGDVIAIPITSTSPIAEAITLSIGSTPDIVVSGAALTNNGDGTGSIDWPTDVADIGSYDVTATATTLSGVSTETFSITVLDPDATVLFRINAGGPEIAAADGGIPWSEDQALAGADSGGAALPGAPSDFWVAGVDKTYGTADPIDVTSLPAGTIETLFQTERYDPPTSTGMVYEFPVGSGQAYEVDLYFAEIFATANGIREFTVNIEGVDVLVDYDVHELVGHDTGIVATFTSPIIAQDDNLTITFVAQVENPKVNAIEVRTAGPPPTDVPPLIDAIADASVSVGGSLIVPISTTELDGDAITLAYTSNPDPALFTSFVDNNNGTGSLTFAPVAGDSGTYTVVVTATDKDGIDTEVFNLNVLEPVANVYARINAGGPLVPSIDAGPDWGQDNTASPSPFLADGGSNGNSGAAAVAPNASVPAYVPGAVVDTERWSSTGFSYDVGVPAGTQVFVRLFLGNAFAGTSTVGARVFDITIDGVLVEDDLDLVAEYGNQLAGMREYLVTSDGTVDIDFSNVVENPLVNAIEVAAAQSSPGVLNANPSSIDFGVTLTGGSASETVTLSNLGFEVGDPDVTITGVAVNGGGEFTTNFVGPILLGAGASDSFNVTFSPTADGAQADTVSITHTGSNTPLIVTLAGDASNNIPVSFSQTGLSGESSTNPTSLQFGPDGRLYVAQQDATIKAYTVQRNSANDYAVTATETINLVKSATTNHDDDGSANTSSSRQMTGLLLTGTAANPIIYATSSDNRIAVGNDTGLDTNSGVVSKLTFNGTSWDKIDIVRGLPRSEENHSTNGLALDEGTNTLYVMQGGHANKGAPGNNFSGTPEYYLSAALLSVDLDAIDTTFIDARDGAEVGYDLRTLDDPTRPNITNVDAAFPYPVGHPLYGASIDEGDPFGGNNSLNQAIPEPGGPVQIYSPGYRNAFDVVFTSQGRLYTSDNGPNGGWGGVPLSYDSNDAAVSTGSGPYELSAGDYCTNEYNQADSAGHGDTLHFIDGLGYYGGHPAPIRAFPGLARVVNYEEQGDGNWVLKGGIDYDFFGLLPADIPAGFFPDNPVQCDYTSNDPGKYLDIVGASTNGIAEYTATNFGGKLQGNILTASFNGNIYSYDINAAGDSVDVKTSLFSGFGSQPLDVIAQGDGDPFPGTVWAATYGADNITVFEPSDSSSCTGADDINLDEDNDGYTNADEIDNATDPCSGGDKPTDNDGDNLSDLNDPDDDNDGIDDIVDEFAVDPDNGLTTSIPVLRPFENNDPGTFLFGLGLTGLMTNGVDTYLEQFDPNNLAAGGNGGELGVENVTAGDAYQADNSQDNAFQYGVDADTGTDPFVVTTEVSAPIFGDATPANFMSMGLQVGSGDQDNYLKVVVNANGGAGGVQVLKEEAGIATVANQYGAAELGGDVLTAGAGVTLSFVVDPAALTAQPRAQIDGGAIVDLGAPVPIPAAWLDPADVNGFAVGVISTSTGGAGTPFDTLYAYLDVEFVADANNVPTIAAAPTSVTVADGASISVIDITYSDADVADTLTVSLDGTEPSGITLTDAGNGTATISGTPGDGAGIFNFDVTVTDGSDTDSVTVTIDVTGVTNAAPTIDPIADTTVAEGDLLTQAVTATDADPLTYALAGDVPVGLEIDGSGEITWTPDLDDSGTYALTVEVSDGINPAVAANFSVAVTQTDTGTVLRRINAGGPQVAATDGGPDWSADPGDTSSTPELIAGGNKVYGGNTPVTDITDPTVPASTPLQVFNSERYDLPSATDPEMAWKFAVAEGTVVEVRLGHAEIFSGAQSAGTRVFDIEIDGVVVESGLDPFATAGTGQGFVTDYVVTADADGLDIVFIHDVENPNVKSIEIIQLAAAPNAAPTIDSVDPAWPITASQGQPIPTVTVTASDPNGDVVTLSTDGNEPAGILFTPGTGTFDGTATAAPGTYDVVVTASDGTLTDTATVTFDVVTNDPPVFDNAAVDGSGTEMNSYSQQVVASDGDGDTITYSLTAAPVGMTISSTGLIEWTPDLTGSGVYDITVGLDDGVNASVTDNFTLSIAHSDPSGSPLFRVNAGGPAVASADGSFPAWAVDTAGSPSPYYVPGSGAGTASGAANVPSHSTVPSSAPTAMYQTERYGDAQYEFPVSNGTEVEVRIHLNETYAPEAPTRSFNIIIEGATVATNINPTALAGGQNTPVVLDFLATSDGTLDVDLFTVADNASVKGIEIIGVSGTPSILIENDLDGSTIDSGSLTVEWLFNGFDNGTGTDHAHFSISSDGGTTFGPVVPMQTSQNTGGTHNTVFRPATSIDLTDLADGDYVAQVQVADAGHQAYGNPEATATATFTVANPTGPITSRYNAGGPTVTANDGGPDWLADSTNPPLAASSGSSIGGFAIQGYDASAPSYAQIDALFLTERYDGSDDGVAGAGMTYEIPVSQAGAAATVNLFLMNGWSGTSAAGQRLFDVYIEGTQVLDEHDLSGTYGHQVAALESFPVIDDGDGVITIVFDHGAIQAPMLNAIEVIG